MDTEPSAPDLARFSVGELADVADVSRRAVRFYVQRGLLAPPIGVGRGAYYTADHLDRLLTLKRLQAEGLSLDDVAAALATPSSSPTPLAPPPALAPAVPEAWLRVEVAPGVELQVKAGALGRAQLNDIVDALRERLAAHHVPDGPTTAAATRGGDTHDDHHR